MRWDDHDVRIINGMQSGLPVVSQPFAQVGWRLGMSEEEVLKRIASLVVSGIFSRFGPLVNAERLGGGVTLAAMCLPAPELARVAELVNGFTQVSQNYIRDHPFNLWFVVATATHGEIARVVADIEETTGHPVYPMPKQREYRVGFRLAVDSEGQVRTMPWEDPAPVAILCEAADHALVAAMQSGLPLVARPFLAVAEGLGWQEEAVLERVQRLLAGGVFRRLGGVPNHYRLGLRANGMSVWSVPEARIDALGERVAALGFVTHCYHRPSPVSHWPYNLFAMLHGQQREEVVAKAARVAEVLGDDNLAGEILFSTAVLKKTGLRLTKKIEPRPV